MNNQRFLNQQSFNFKNMSSILALYFYALGTLFLGYATYLLYTSNSEQSPTSWVGESMFWGLIVFFIAIFILFLPVEFFNKTKIYNSGFNEMIVNILIIIFTSLIFLIIFQSLIQANNQVLSDIKTISRSISFSGFIVMPITIFILNNFVKRFNFVESYTFSFLLLVWIFSAQLFL